MKFVNNVLVNLIVIFGVYYVNCKKLPTFIEYCSRNSPKPELLACFQRAIDVIQPRLLNGIPELLIPSMNPLIIPEAGLDNGANFKAKFKNIEIYHANHFDVTHLDVDLDNFIVDLSIHFPKMRIKSVYNIDGRILILQLKGSGPADGNFTDVSARIVATGSLYPKNGKHFVKIENKTLDMNLGKPVFRFDGIFKDNEELNDQTNKIINENIVDILDELKPITLDAVKTFVFALIERIFSRFAFDDLFPDK